MRRPSGKIKPVPEWDPFEHIAQFPHCDPLVLHKPGECEYCDAHPEWQALREVWGINFTGYYEQGKLKCPAEVQRDLWDIEHWAGNTPNAGPPTVREHRQAAVFPHDPAT